MRISDWSSDVCSSDLVQCCKQQRARTRPEIKYAPRSVPAEMLHCGLQQCFGVRAGDKNGGRNLKSNGPEIAGADDIGNGFPVHATPHELRDLRWDHDVAKLEQQDRKSTHLHSSH